MIPGGRLPGLGANLPCAEAVITGMVPTPGVVISGVCRTICFGLGVKIGAHQR
jgi:hypothetical protein